MPTSSSQKYAADYNLMVVVSRQETLGQAIEKISEIIKIPSDEFRCAKGQKKPQLKDRTVTLKELSMTNQSILHLTLGRPLKIDEIMVNVSLYSIQKQKKRFKFLFKIAVSLSMKHKDPKVELLKYLRDLKPGKNGKGNAWGIEHMRLRSINNLYSFNIYSDKTTVGKQQYKKIKNGNKVEIAIQKVSKEEEHFNKNTHLLLFLQQWFPETQKFGKVHELLLQRKTQNTYGALRQMAIK